MDTLTHALGGAIMTQQPLDTLESLSEQRLVSISANTLAALECVLEGVDTEPCRVIMRLWLDRAWSDYNEQPANDTFAAFNAACGEELEFLLDDIMETAEIGSGQWADAWMIRSNLTDARDAKLQQPAMPQAECPNCNGTGTRMEWTDTIDGGRYAPYPCECSTPTP